MNNRLISSPETAAFHTQGGRATSSEEKAGVDFWEAFNFSTGFEFALEQDDARDLPPTDPAYLSLSPPSFVPHGAEDVTPSQSLPSLWSPLQCELIEALDNIGYPPFSFSLQLPQLGDIDARLANLTPRGWDISLRFSRESYQCLKDRRESCRRALSDALNCPVNLSFEARESYR
ncbi:MULTISPECIES: type III secretion system HrpP C-terminal domain-containing protein [unclassified Brenneria]|uniref:type III secretion system HrpP C-terminal domain-containing protein n=1 Tax=unclassified Brenneria TaxID=2634434 RepID=UPI0015581E93|nr:type III secretion system HrpP C-terminal domain-containing protein [Brenneria sp. hezel4-2-4]MEE3650485.1 type III secretion system HrpP C-terminal domain-containing protein [Brenneria sp. HEZEL_4_2_4]NPD00441.1 type III secretion protein [Brenneria sp. hezel4-2-4]